MKKLGKKLSSDNTTLQAYLCNCDIACIGNCYSGPPDWAPQTGLVSGSRR
ncbi:putative bacteriocin precursor [Ruminiclostridium sufflavum DSM 19573]|uniref:Putative bacteriocin n=1 Tax=Ruminiclostridium sufflavum DSM 19573 TaxID=1121337 RepID=A0A318XFR9_9FIRM|nr:putative bacteriocin precursor [Ruminiclostridium sufflavum DSM 19573]